MEELDGDRTKSYQTLTRTAPLLNGQLHIAVDGQMGPLCRAETRIHVQYLRFPGGGGGGGPPRGENQGAPVLEGGGGGVGEALVREKSMGPRYWMAADEGAVRIRIGVRIRPTGNTALQLLCPRPSPASGFPRFQGPDSPPSHIGSRQLSRTHPRVHEEAAGASAVDPIPAS